MGTLRLAHPTDYGVATPKVVIPAHAGIQYAAAHPPTVSGIVDRPVEPGDDSGDMAATDSRDHPFYHHEILMTDDY